MSQEANIATTKKLGEAVNKGKLDELHEIFAPGVVDHDPAPDQGKGPEGLIQFFTQFRGAFPDLKIAVDHMVADEDNVPIAYTVNGTHQGPFEGIPATGKRTKARGMQIEQFDSDARIKERWAVQTCSAFCSKSAVTPGKHMDEPHAISGVTIS